MRFEEFLKDRHGETYVGTNDDMYDAFITWQSELEYSDYERYAEEYADFRVREMIKQFNTDDLNDRSSRVPPEPYVGIESVDENNA